MPTSLKDLAFAARILRKSPSFAFTAILTLALGIGASTAIFSVVNAVLLRPLPYANGERLALVWGDLTARGVEDFPMPPGDLVDLRDQGTLLDGVAALTTGRFALTIDDTPPELVRSAGVTTNIFKVLGARVVVGRDFEEADGSPIQPPPGAPAQAAAPPQPQFVPPPAIGIISHELWVRRFASDSNVIGRTIQTGNGQTLVIGVLEPDVELLFPPAANIERRPEVWQAFRIDFAAGSRTDVFLRVIARLKPGVTFAAAQSQINSIVTDLRQRFPVKEQAGLRWRIEPMHKDLVQDVRPAVLALMGAVVFVLLIACANVANLLLVRASGRERELAVRAAIGGSRGRLVRQMLIESLVLAGAAAALGLLLAQWGIDVLRAVAPANVPRIDEIRIDRVVLGFTVAAAVLAAAVFGLIPALRASRADVAAVLRRSGQTAGLRGGKRIRNAVVVAEVALSVVLLVGCGLMLRTFAAMQRVDPGYDSERLLTFLVGNARTTTLESRQAFVTEMRTRLSGISGVTAVTAAAPFPLDGGSASARWGTEDMIADPSRMQQANVHIVQPGYFETMKSRIIDGRVYTEADNHPESRAMVIDERLATKAFPTGGAVGKRLLVRVRTPEPEWYDIIGVVAHQRHTTYTADGREAIFLSDGYMGFNRTQRWAVRTAGNPEQVAEAVRSTVRGLDQRLLLTELQPMSRMIVTATATTRFALTIITIFAVIAAILAAVGLYGVLSTVVRQRTAEIGVRMAFGAPRRSILQLIIGHGLILAAAGIVIGLGAAVGLTRVMRTLLVGVGATDPLTFVSIAVVFGVIATAASWIPAQRAAGLEPTVALREE